MLELVVGTRNPAKAAQIKAALKPLRLSLTSLAEMNVNFKVVEDGTTARENAYKRAIAFAKAVNKMVIAVDKGLFFDCLPDIRQPGINVRRTKGSNEYLSEEQIIEYYSGLIEQFGGDITGRWEFAVCLAEPLGQFWETTLDLPRRFVSKPSLRRIPGFPLFSLQIDLETGRYLSEMSSKERELFWQRQIGKGLRDFVKRSLNL